MFCKILLVLLFACAALAFKIQFDNGDTVDLLTYVAPASLRRDVAAHRVACYTPNTSPGCFAPLNITAAAAKVGASSWYKVPPNFNATALQQYDYAAVEAYMQGSLLRTHAAFELPRVPAKFEVISKFIASGLNILKAQSAPFQLPVVYRGFSNYPSFQGKCKASTIK